MYFYKTFYMRSCEIYEAQYCVEIYDLYGVWLENCNDYIEDCGCDDPAPEPEIINCLRGCTEEGVQDCIDYYDSYGRWMRSCNDLIILCGCEDGGGDDDDEWTPVFPIDRDMMNCTIGCENQEAVGCWEYLHVYGELPPGCKQIMKDCGCYDADDPHDCRRKALAYLKNELTIEPYNNACEVLEYIRTRFKCVTKGYDLEDLITPGDTDDGWTDGGGNDDNGSTDGPYDEAQRKPIWWYHTDHLGSSTYLTDNFGRPSHYYETLPFGEMIVEHNQSTSNIGGYDNKFKFNGKELDNATQMYYYGARYYDPRISIFVSVDPLAEQTMEPYLYTGNNPIAFKNLHNKIAQS